MNDHFVNLGEEVIMTLLWQSGACESATVCFVISLNIFYWLFKCGVERPVREWERERERERERVTVESAVLIAACVQTHTSIITVSVTRLCSPLGLELMVKLRTLLTVFILKDEAHDYGKGSYISNECLWCSANHNALGQLANQSRLCLSGLCRKRSVWERRGIEYLQ